MSYVPVVTLLDGVLRTLRDEVLPSLRDRQARTKLYATLDILNNLRDRIEEKRSFVEQDLDSLRQTLAQAAARLSQAGKEGLAASLRTELDEATSLSLDERHQRWNQAWRRALAAAQRLEPGLREALLQILMQRATAQCLREVLVLKPSALREISEG